MPNWLDTAIAVAESFATVVVAWVRILLIRRERAQQARLERSAVVRISGIAYLLRRQILAWVGSAKPEEMFFDRWIENFRIVSGDDPVDGVNRELTLAVQRAVEMLA